METTLHFASHVIWPNNTSTVHLLAVKVIRVVEEIIISPPICEKPYGSASICTERSDRSTPAVQQLLTGCCRTGVATIVVVILLNRGKGIHCSRLVANNVGTLGSFAFAKCQMLSVRLTATTTHWGLFSTHLMFGCDIWIGHRSNCSTLFGGCHWCWGGKEQGEGGVAGQLRAFLTFWLEVLKIKRMLIIFFCGNSLTQHSGYSRRQ